MPETRSGDGAGKALVLLAPCVFLVGLDTFVTIPLIPAIAGDTGIPSDLGALLVTAYALAYAVSAPLFGAISDRAGRKRVICFGALILGVGTALTGLSSTLTSLLLLRALTGAGAGALQPGVFAYVGDKVPYQARGRAMGTILASMSSATILGVPVGAYLAGIGSWRWPFWAIGLLAFLTLLAVGLLLPKDTPGSETAGSTPGSPVPSVLGRFRTAFSTPSVLFALLATFLWFGSLQGMFANVGTFYARGFGLKTAQIGLILAAAGLGTVVGSTLGGRLADRWGKRAVAAGSGGLCAASVLGFSLTAGTGSVAVAVAVQVAWATVFGCGQAALTTLVSELAPAGRGTVLSLNSSFMFAGSTAFTAASAALLSVGGFVSVGVLSAVAALLVLPLVVYLVKERAADEPPVKANPGTGRG